MMLLWRRIFKCHMRFTLGTTAACVNNLHAWTVLVFGEERVTFGVIRIKIVYLY